MERLRSAYSELSGGSPKDVHLELVNMTLLRKRCNSVKHLKRKSSWMMQVDPKSNAKCPYKQRKRQNWKGHKWEVIWWRKQRLEQCGQEPRCACSHQKWEDSPWQISWGVGPCPHLDFKALASRTEREKISAALTYQTCSHHYSSP